MAFSNGPRTQQANEPGTKPPARQRLYDSGTGQPYKVVLTTQDSTNRKEVGHRFHARLHGHYSYLCKADRRQAPLAVSQIRVHLTRNQIRNFRLNTEPDPGFWWQKIEKNLQLKKTNIFLIKNCDLPIPRPQKRTSKLKKKPQPSKKNIQHFKTWNFLIFLNLWVIFALLDPDPDSEFANGSTDLTESGSNPEPDPKYCPLALLLPPVTTCMKQEGGQPLGPALPGSQSLQGIRPPTYPPSQARDPTSDLHFEQMNTLSNNSTY